MKFAMFAYVSVFLGLTVAILLGAVLAFTSFYTVREYRAKSARRACLMAGVFVLGVGLCLFPQLVDPRGVKIARRLNSLTDSVEAILAESPYSELKAKSVFCEHFGWHVYVTGMVDHKSDLREFIAEFRKQHAKWSPIKGHWSNGNLMLHTEDVAIRHDCVKHSRID